MTALEQKGLLAAPLCTAIGMGGGEEGLLGACDAAAAAGANAIVTIGGGAVHDAGKLVRLWLAAAAARKQEHSDAKRAANLDDIRAMTERADLDLAPQVCAPNSFAMAELTSVAGATTKANVKSGAAHAALMPTVVVYDPVLSAGLPDWGDAPPFEPGSPSKPRLLQLR